MGLVLRSDAPKEISRRERNAALCCLGVHDREGRLPSVGPRASQDLCKRYAKLDHSRDRTQIGAQGMPPMSKGKRKRTPSSAKRPDRAREANPPSHPLDQKVRQIIAHLHRLYPDARTELHHDNPLQLLVATILSAQATDKRVNEVGRQLFQKYRTARDIAEADPAVFEQEIRSTGCYRNKTRNVLGAARRLVEAYGGKVPDSMEQILTLPGVARKTANVVLGTAFGKATGVVVDTHVKRLAFRLGLSEETVPERIEQDLMGALPEDEWIYMGHALIWHGRRVCHARRPACGGCCLRDLCPRNGVSLPL
jgi:endonuclease-3